VSVTQQFPASLFSLCKTTFALTPDTPVSLHKMLRNGDPQQLPELALLNHWRTKLKTKR
jgi:hypothetical protein